MISKFIMRNMSRKYLAGVARLSTSNIAGASAGVETVPKGGEFYNTITKQFKFDDSKPDDWDDARPYEELPGPKPLPIVGNTWRFLPIVGDLHNIQNMELFKIFKESYGNIVGLKNIFGRKDMVFIFDPKDVETIHRNSGPYPIRQIVEVLTHYRSVTRKEMFEGGTGLATLQGEEWFKMRSVVNPILMQITSLHQYIPTVDKVSKELVSNMKYFSKVDKNHQMPANFVDEMSKWGLETVGLVALNRRFDCLKLNGPEDSEVRQLLWTISKFIDSLYDFEMKPPLWKYFNTPTYKEFVRKNDFLVSVTLRRINEARLKITDNTLPEHERTVLQRLLERDPILAIVMVLEFIIGGVDTISKTLGGILYLLAKNPDKQTKLREEILRNLSEKDSTVTVEALGKSPYLKAVIRECNRVAAVSSATRRTTPKNIVLGGYQIPKGTEVLAVTKISSLSEEYYENPKAFLPERWLREESGKIMSTKYHPFSSLPFGFGPRSCIGMRYANLTLEVALMNTEVLAVTKISSLSEEYYENPKAFLPERWLREESGKIMSTKYHPFSSLPFGFGPRSCIGMRYANLTLEVALMNVSIIETKNIVGKG